ncbi:MAG: hypothetical protein QNJ31_06235 [Candidatus Caenarcaniphilales bacterium]|nr:hypothetical protein [Candidatus Caenarcaniphilales bacterium]
MLLQPGKPIPKELLPLNKTQVQGLVDHLLTTQVIQNVQNQLALYKSEWSYLDNNRKLSFLDNLHSFIFGNLFPRPVSKVTFSRVRFTASFHSEDWSMRFSENFFTKYSVEQIFKTWLHESYHAFLHFSGIRLNPGVAVDVFAPPRQVIELARKMPIRDDGSIFIQLIKRNLLGCIDRSVGQVDTTRTVRSVRLGDNIFTPRSSYQSMAGTGLDSYYLNVEINVENLTEMTFKKVAPYAPFRRSYVTAEEYIRKRLNGEGPVYAAQQR